MNTEHLSLIEQCGIKVSQWARKKMRELAEEQERDREVKCRRIARDLGINLEEAQKLYDEKHARPWYVSPERR